jgi:hypothetical protein
MVFGGAPCCKASDAGEHVSDVAQRPNAEFIVVTLLNGLGGLAGLAGLLR